MGKGGRACCIAAPWLLTVASFICLILIEISGWNKGMLSSYYFMQADFTDMDLSGSSDVPNSEQLEASLRASKRDGTLANVYNVHLWNYCSSDDNDAAMDYCAPRRAGYVFNPVTVWKLDRTTTAGTPTSSSSNAAESVVNAAQDKVEQFEQDTLGDAGKKALDAYKKVSKAMFVMYAIAFWATLATLALSILAIFSRWGSLLTWVVSGFSTIMTTAAVATSSALFIAMNKALQGVLSDYNIHISIGRSALTVNWLGVIFSWAATLFWLFSICCCSGSSNPHHRSNKGGLWNAEPKGMGYGDYGRGRGLRVEKTGGGYERVASPFLGHAQNEHGDRVPLNDYPQQPAQSGSYEPFRHG